MCVCDGISVCECMTCKQLGIWHTKNMVRRWLPGRQLVVQFRCT